MGSSTWPWLVAILGFIVLGLAIAYGMSRNSRRTEMDRRVSAAGTRQIYHEEETRPGRD